jgi:hypothetical protein
MNLETNKGRSFALHPLHFIHHTSVQANDRRTNVRLYKRLYSNLLSARLEAIYEVAQRFVGGNLGLIG